MIEVKGRYNTAVIYSDEYDDTAYAQILELCNQESLADSHIRIMPDYHAGKGCVIGTTMQIKDKIIPNLVGVDVACGVVCVNLGTTNVNLENLDKFIRENIPSGKNAHDKCVIPDAKEHIDKLKCAEHLKDKEWIEPMSIRWTQKRGKSVY